MPIADFVSRLVDVQQRRSSVVCVGLDPDPDRLPRHLLAEHTLPDAVVAFNRAIIQATASVTSAYKLNLAFYEAIGAEGWRVLEETLAVIPDDAITLADGKRGDIGNSVRFYAGAVFDQLGFDACTVSGYMGRDSVVPFLEYEGRAAFLLVRTSNPGAVDFQDVTCESEDLFMRVARLSAAWDVDRPGTLGFVVGAADLGALRQVRDAHPEVPLLIPGIGAQGGDARGVMQMAGEGPVLINSSRGIIYASDGRDFDVAAGDAAEELRATLERLRAS